MSTRVARWAIELQDYEYVVEHRKGTRMQHVDALSRAPIQVCSITARVKQAQDSSDRIQHIRQQIIEKKTTDYGITNDIIYKIHQGRQLLVINEDLAENIIRKCHEENGHFGADKVADIVKQQYYCEHLSDLIHKWISNCLVCIISDKKRGKKEGFLHPIPKEDRPLQTYHVDHMGPMTETDKQYRYIFAVIDAFSKFDRDDRLIRMAECGILNSLTT